MSAHTSTGSETEDAFERLVAYCKALEAGRIDRCRETPTGTLAAVRKTVRFVVTFDELRLRRPNDAGVEDLTKTLVEIGLESYLRTSVEPLLAH